MRTIPALLLALAAAGCALAPQHHAYLEQAESAYEQAAADPRVARLAPGELRSASEVLARAGNSGGHEESGVYFELRKGAQPVDPMEWLGR